MKNLSDADQYRSIRTRLIIWVFMVLLGAAHWSFGAGGDLAALREQVAAAEEADDKAAAIELSRRIVALAPNDSEAWLRIAQGQFAAEDYDRVAETLKAWRKAVKNPPATVDDLEGDLALKLKDPADAEKHYLAFLGHKPSKTEAGDMYEKLADLCVDQQRIKEAEAYLTKALAAEDTPSRRIFHATSLLRLHRWDAAYAEMDKANKANAADAEVKQWQPQFELLSDFLPDIKKIEAQLATKPNDVDLLLNRAHLFAEANRPILALDDCERARKLDPASMRARIQTGEALLDQNRSDDAAKLQVGSNLARDSKRHLRDSVLDGLAEKDEAIAKDPNNAQELAERAEILRGLNQYVLALSDAQAALAIDEDSAAGTYEAAANLRALERPKEALEQAMRATELSPKNSAAWFLRGSLEADRAEYPAAIESITHSLELDESLDGLKVRENCERRINLTDKAEADSKRIHELDPNSE